MTLLERRQETSSIGLKPVIVAVIPAYNEERFIASVVLQAKRYATHVIVVDDGSTDQTADLATQVGATVIRQTPNQGKAAALNVGFEWSLNFEPPADVIVCLDGDAQHDASEIPLVSQPIVNKEADIVIGSRFLTTKSKIPLWRQFGQHSLNSVTNILSGVKISDTQSGFRAFSPEVAKTLNFSSQGLSVESEMQFLFKSSGYNIKEIPISVRYMDGNKRNPIVHGMRVLDAMLSLVAQRRPLTFIALPGLLIWLTSIITGFSVVTRFNQTNQLATGTAIATAILFISGVLLGISGVMLHTVGNFAKRIKADLINIVSQKVKHGQN